MTLKSLNATIQDKKLAMAVLNGVPPQFKAFIVVLAAHRERDKTFAFSVVKSRPLQEELHIEMHEFHQARSSSSTAFSHTRDIRNIG